MTKRYSVEEVAEMLRSDRERTRAVVAALAARKVLSGESFLVQDGSWRIAPSDLIRIQTTLREQEGGGDDKAPKARRIVKKTIAKTPESES